MTTTTIQMRTRGGVKRRTVRTTTLEIERPASFAPLESRFRVERYVLPDDLRYSTQNSAVIFGQVHNALRAQLECAYKAFKHDRLDGMPRWAVYALFPCDAQPTPVTLPWHRNRGELPHRSVPFAEVPFHITLKLLQIALFRGATSARFVGRDSCYAYARPAGGDFHYCVRVELQGARDAGEADPTQEFRVIPHAVRFGLADPAYARPWDALYGKRAVGDRFYFLHLKAGQPAGERAVYREVRFADRRARVKYHDPRALDAGRGKILDDFIRDFLAHLRDLGIAGAPRRRTLTQFKAPDRLDLDFTRLGAVGVYDNRLARDAHPLADYVDLFARLRPDVAFVPIERPTDAPARALLALLDATAADFAQGGVLAGREDPYPPLYRTTPDIAKQSLVVNFNDPSALNGGDYLEYPFPAPPQERDLALRLEVALNELYLKGAIVGDHREEHLPWPLTPADDRAFVRKRCYDGETYTTALWFRDGRPQFADLGDPDARQAVVAMMARWGVDYGARFEEYLNQPGRAEEPPAYDFIVGPDLFVAIEELQERVLYAYGEIERRRRERATLRPIDDFKLTSHYEALKSADMRPLAELLGAADGGLAQASAAGLARPSAALERSRAFYRQLLEFDRLLDEIAITHPTISLDELGGEAWMGEIARIFGGTRGDGKPHRRTLLEKYRTLNLFLSDRGDDVQLSQGIWYDETGAFIVGAPTPMNIGGQENAHVFRRFRVLQGEGHFDGARYLAAMAVQFVRPRQYTVLPYQYHLIDLYVENVRRYEMAALRDAHA